MAADVVIAVGTRGVSAAVRSITRLEDRSSKFGKAMAGAVVGGALVATAAVVKFGAASVRAASESQQSIGATETVYGKYASTVIRESKRAANSLGLSANEYRELANVSGAMLKSSGVPLREVTSLTAKLEKRAADVAATFGGSTREAVEAFNAVLRGETDPVERYGVSIKQVDVNARLAAKGQDKLTGAAGKQAGAMARLDLLFGQTKSSAGQFARESDTLAGAQQRLDAKIENVQARFGKLLLPVLTEGVNLISRKVIPAAEDLAGWLEQNSDEIERTGRSIATGLLPPLQTLGSIAEAAAKLVAGLPPELQSLAAQGAAAAIVVPRLTGAISTATGTVGGYAKAVRDAETRTAALSGAARTAAGVGGVLALSQAAGESNKGLQALGTIGGGALLGFAAGGPVGAAVGGTAGALLSMKQSADRARDSLTQAEPPAANYAATLDKITGAATKASREVALLDLQQRGALPAAAQLGVTQRDLVSAALGQEGALKRVNAVLNETSTVSGVTVDAFGNITATINGSASPAAQKLSSVLGIVSSDLADQAAKTRDSARATERLSVVYKGVPRDVITRIRQLGGDVALGELRKLSRQVQLTPKTIRIIARQNNIDLTAKQVRNLTRDVEKAGKVKPPTPNLAPWLRGLKSALTGGKQEAGRGAEGVARELGRGTKNAKANLSGFNSSLQSGLATSKQWASSGGKQTGNALGQGMYGGVDAWAGPIAGRAASIVSAAVAAARRAADAHSPSRKMIRLGDDMGEGLALGLRRSERTARTEGQKLAAAVRAGVVRGSAGFDQAWGKVTAVVDRTLEQQQRAREKSIRKRLDGKAENRALAQLEKRSKRRARIVTKGLADERAALAANAHAQDVNNQKLEDARRTLADLKQARADYVASVRDTVVATGSLTTLGEGTGFGSVAQLIAQRKAAAAEAAKFNAVIASLRGKRLNDTDLQELIDQGPAALGVAQAIDASGTAAIGELNDLQKQLLGQGTALGQQASAQFKDAGVKAAQGIVTGLESQAAKLDRQAIKLANALVKAVKKALGIKSPSRVFAGLGEQTARGLQVGIAGQDTYVRRSGAQMAASLQKGFGAQRFEAMVNTGSSSTPTTVVNLAVTAPVGASSVAIGRELQRHLDAYFGSGGSRRAH